MIFPQRSCDGQSQTRQYVLLCVSGLLFISLIGLALWWGPTLWPILSDRERFRAWIESYHAAAALVFVLVQCLQVVVFFIPGEVTQFAGGYVFGTWKGLLLSYLGITLGSVIAFLFARFFGRPAVTVFISHETLRKFDRLVYGKSGFWPMLVLFFLPGIPKDLLCYIAGLTPMPLATFVLISTIGRFPGVLLSCILGDGLAERNWKTFGLSAAVAVGLLGIMYLCRRPLEKFRKSYLMTQEEAELLGTPYRTTKQKTRPLYAASDSSSGKSST
jgi:uncharacterized membrane protein YdjX (TVP38/TMEM64 family)